MRNYQELEAINLSLCDQLQKLNQYVKCNGVGVQELNFAIRITKWKTMLILVSASERMDFNRIVRFELHIRTSVGRLA